jgi:hypothetical protein
MSTVTQPRDHLVRALQADLIGPYQLDEDSIVEQELLELPPSRHYLTGFLAPEGEREPEEVAEDDNLQSGDDDNEEETGGSAQEEPKGRALWPASIGMSVLLQPSATAVDVTVRFAEYFIENVKQSDKKRPQPRWRRKPKQSISTRVPLDQKTLENGILLKDTTGLVLEGRLQPVDSSRGVPDGTQALSLFLVNRRGAGDKGRRDLEFIFQVEMEIACDAGIIARPDHTGEGSEDWDTSVSDLQFRNRCEYAVGHNISVEIPPGQTLVQRVKTTWIPSYEVRPVVPHEDPDVCVVMDELAAIKTPEEVVAKLGRLPVAYGDWIARQRLGDIGDGPRARTRKELMDRATVVRDRISSGIELLASDAQCRRAFCLTNQAMAIAARRRSPERYVEGKKPPMWRLFQLAFLLLNLRGLVDGRDPERQQVELIFFPTGGGKTEAYLGVIAFTLVLRRLRRAKRSDGGLGVAVLLRYTLRLLTLDQLGRAATLICALESERRRVPAELGDTRFSVGLWVGRTATANTMEEVSKLVTNYKNGIGESPCPLPVCPWCSKPLGPASLNLHPGRTSPEEVRVGCLNESCEFSCANNSEGIPVLFVDDQVYRELPSFLIATVDKFAMLPWRGEAGMLFGKVTARDGRRFFGPMDSAPKTGKPLAGGLLPPELIVQDELHLISGPLGTMVGLYETAIEHLCTLVTPEGPVRPKLVAATATVRRADAQIRALYGRNANEVTVFPPPGIDDSETFFAEVEKDLAVPGRRYIGVAAQGRSMKALLLRIYRGLLAAAMKNYDPVAPLDQTADCYMTLAGYFNSLRELGGMRRLVEDEVRERVKHAEDTKPINVVGGHVWFKKRDRDFEPVELTSRESTDKIKRSKDRLGKHFNEEQAVDVLLASNMISVGIDIERLGLMVIAGQPKTTAEYIQASSRVGRQAKWPGLVVTAFNIHKARDRSHYEHFEAYHQSFYRFVEATSVTPFSGPALDRGYVGALAAMIRFANSNLTPGKGVMALPKFRELADTLVSVIAQRGAVQPGLDQAACELRIDELKKLGANLLDHWQEQVSSTADEPKQRRYSKYDREKTGGKPLLCTVLDEGRDERFTAPTSMRDVESTAHLWVVGRKLGRGVG